MNKNRTRRRRMKKTNAKESNSKAIWKINQTKKNDSENLISLMLSSCFTFYLLNLKIKWCTLLKPHRDIISNFTCTRKTLIKLHWNMWLGFIIYSLFNNQSSSSGPVKSGAPGLFLRASALNTCSADKTFLRHSWISFWGPELSPLNSQPDLWIHQLMILELKAYLYEISIDLYVNKILWFDNTNICLIDCINHHLFQLW